jgi:hypothetical protein
MPPSEATESAEAQKAAPQKLTRPEGARRDGGTPVYPKQHAGVNATDPCISPELELVDA